MAGPPEASEETRSEAEPNNLSLVIWKSDLEDFGFSCRISVQLWYNLGSVVVLGFTLIFHPIKLIRCLLIAWELGSIGFSCRSPKKEQLSEKNCQNRKIIRHNHPLNTQ